MLREKLDAALVPWEFRQFFAALMIILLILPSSAAYEVMAAPGPQDSPGKATPLSMTAASSTGSAAQSGVSKGVGSGTIMEAAVSRQAPTLNGGAVEGSLRVFEGKNYSLGSGFSLTGDLYTVGTPEIDLQAGASHGGVVDDGGAATPSYKLKLEKDVKLPGKIHIRADPVPLPADIPTTVPAPAGTRRIKINQASDVESIGDWSTVWDLTVNAPDVMIDVPPGNYDSIVLNGPCVIRFSAGDYNLASGLSLHQSSSLQVAGPASVTLGASFETNGGKILASTGTAPHQVRLNILGNTVNLAGDAELQALVRAIDAHVSLSADSVIRGQLLADRLTLTGGRIIGDVRPVDTTAPIVQILSPADSSWTYSSSVTVQGTAKDEGEISSGVASVSVNGVPATFDPATGNWMVKVPLAVGSNVLAAEATDNAERPNTGRVEIQVERRNPPPPTLSITYPADGAYVSNNLITVAGRAVSEAAEVSVAVMINGQPATVAGGQFTGTVSLADGLNSISVQALDSLGQTSQLTSTVTCDSNAPQVSFTSVPAIVLPGSTYRLVAEASDDQRLVSVELTIDGQKHEVLTAAPYEFSYLVPSSAQPGRRLTAAVLARDASGRMGTDTAQMRVAGPGGIAGRVFDDSTGYALTGVAITSTDGAVTQTSEDGAYFAVSPSSQGVARFARSGYTAVERDFALDAGKGAWLADARLTPIDPHTNVFGPAGGTALGDSGRIRLVIPSGVLTEPVDIRLTSVSQQGLVALLPFAWSPVPGGVVDVRAADPLAHALDLTAGAAVLTVSELPDFTDEQPVCLALYEESDHRWVVLDPEVSPSTDGTLSVPLKVSGQYALLVPDSGSTAPPHPTAGSPLPAGPVPVASALNAASALATATPRTALYSASAQSTIRVTATPPAKLPSGTWCEASFDERYDIRTQSEPKFVERAAQTLVLYSYPAASAQDPNVLSASFVAKPTMLDIPQAEFRAANLHVRIRAAEPDSGSLVDGEGGTVTAPGGWELVVPAGALSSAAPLFLRPVASEDLALELPDGYEVAGSVLVDLSGQTLAAGARLSAPATWGDNARLVVARIIVAGDRRAPKLVARAAEINGVIVSTTEPPVVPPGIVLPGIKEGGLYVFLRLPTAFGYVFGQVSRAGGSIASGVRVSTDTSPFADVTASDGTYLLPGVAGQGPDGVNNLAAASLASDETGNGTVTLPLQDSLAQVHIAVASILLQVASVSPVAGSTDVPVSGTVRVSFTKPVNPASLTGSSFRLATAAGSPVAGTITVLAGNQAATFVPSASLTAGTGYRVGVTTVVEDLYGHPLSAAFQSAFTTAPIQPVASRLTPERVTISYPDAQGFVTITIPAGLIPAGSAVVAVNVTLGSSTTVTAGSGPLTVRLLASPGDDIRIMVREPSGVSYEVAQAAYRTPDGFSAVGTNGGTITGADGRIALVIEPGTISGLAEIRLTELSESTIPIPREPGSQMDPANVRFAAGVRIESRGSFTVHKEPHLEVAAPAGTVEGQRGACLKPARAIDPETGQEVDVWETVTATRVENGRMKTTSPPFTGLDLTGMTLYMFLPIQMRVIYGSATEPPGGDGSAPPVPQNGACPHDPSTGRPVADVLAMVQQHGVGFLQHQVTARTNSKGVYCIFDMRFDSPNSAVVLFIDEAHRRKTAGSGIPPMSMEMQFLYGLQGFVTLRADGLFCPVGVLGGDGKPVIHLYGEQLGLAPTEPDPLTEQGVARVGKQVKIYAVVDRSVGLMEGQVTVGNAEAKALQWQRDTVSEYGQPRFSTLVDVDAEGGYLVKAQAWGTPGSLTTKGEAEYRFVGLRNPNERPPLPGQPFVLSVFPKEAAENVDVSTEIRVEMSEPVIYLRGGVSIYLDSSDGRIGGMVLSGGIPVTDAIPVSSIVFKPERVLRGGRAYTLTLTDAIKDTNNTGLCPFTSEFTTFAGMALTEMPVGQPGVKVSLDGHYAFTVEGYKPGTAPNAYESSILTAFDVSDPTQPTQIGSGFQIPQRGIDMAVSSKSVYTLTPEKTVRRIGVVTAYYYWIPERPANLWILNLDDPANPVIIGVVSLYFPKDLPTSPFCVKLHEGRAYIGNAPYRGVIVVDIQKAIDVFRQASKTARVKPEWQAVAQYGGFGLEALIQSTVYAENPSQSTMATAIDVISQNVPPGGAMINGPMPVAFAANYGAKALVAVGFSTLYDGVQPYLPGGAFDKRVLSWETLPGYPLGVRVMSGVIVAGRLRDVAVVLGMKPSDGSTALWVYDVTDATAPTLLDECLLSSLGIEGSASRAFDVEGTLAYLNVGDEIVVIDLALPHSPSVVTVLPASVNAPISIAVRQGFIHTLSLLEGMSVRIARPVSQVFVHGMVPGDSNRCANPVLVNRVTPHKMVHPAEVYFQIFGGGSANTATVEILKNGVTYKPLVVTTLDSGHSEILTGRAVWEGGADEVIDLTAQYAVKVFTAGHTSDVVPVPMSFLIADYQETAQAYSEKETAGEDERPPYAYVLGANAQVEIDIGGTKTSGYRAFGLNNERLILGALKPGRYPLKLKATTAGGYSEEVGGVVEISRNPNNLRLPGHTVVGGVDLATGHLGLTYTDVFIKFHGLALEFTRSYNQGAANVFGPVGYGWRHNYQMLLVYNRDRQVYTVFGPDGQGQSFPKGQERSLPPFHTRLVANEDGSFDYFDKAHVKYHFPGALERDSFTFYRQSYLGNLEYIEEPNKNRLQLSYDSDGRLEKVQEKSGDDFYRTLEFKYEEALVPFVGMGVPQLAGLTSASCIGEKDLFPLIRDHFAQSDVARAWRIKQLLGPGGLQIDYEYDLDGNLKKVTRKGVDGISVAAGHDYVWGYEYGPTGISAPVDVRHILKNVKNPNDADTTYEYLPDNVALPLKLIRYPESVTTGFEFTPVGAVNFTGVKITDGNGNPTDYTLDNNGYVTKIAAPRGASTDQLFIDGLKVFERDPEQLVTTYEYDDVGNPTNITIGSLQIKTTFDSTFSKLTSITDANGRTTSYTIDSETGNVTGIGLPTGSNISLVYEANGDLIEEYDERGLSTKYGHDPWGNVEMVTRETGNGPPVVSEYGYDERSRLTRSSGKLNPEMTYTLDALDRVSQVEAKDTAGIRDSYTADYTYKPGGEVLTLSKSGGDQSYAAVYTHDGLSRLKGVAEDVSRAGSFSRSYSYDKNSNLVSATDRRSVTTTYTYDPLNFLTTVQTGALTTTVIAPDLVGNAKTVTDLGGKTEILGYDPMHRLTSRTWTVGDRARSETLTLDGNGNVTVRESNGRVTATTHDELNRPVTIVDAVGRPTRITYDDSSGRVTTVDPRRGLTSVTATDGIGRIARSEQSYANKSCATTYDYDGLHVRITDPRGVRTDEDHSTYGDIGSSSTVRTGGLSPVTETRKYYAFGAVKTSTDARLFETTYVADGLNHTLSESRGSSTDGYTYDGEGNLLTHTDPTGVTEKTEYDLLGRVTRRAKVKRDVSELVIETITYTDRPGTDTVTDPAGITRVWPYKTRKQVTDALGGITVSRYDEERRVISETNPESWTRSFTYDPFGNLESETDFSGKTTTYKYDALDRLTSITDPSGKTTTVAIEDGEGETVRRVDRRGVPTVERRDAMGRLRDLTVGGQLVKAETCDCNGNVTESRDGAGVTSVLVHDELNRLVEVRRAGVLTASYTRDEAGNVTGLSDGRGGVVLQTFDRYNRLESRSDGAGNITRFEYDPKGRLAKKTEPRLDAGGQPLVTSYEYNEFDSLTKVVDAARNEWVYGYDQNQRLTTIDDPTAHPPTRLEYTTTGRVSKVIRPDGVESVYEYDGAGNRTLAIDTAGHRVRTTYDATNRPRTIAVTRADGSLPDGARGYAYEFDPEGNLTRVDERVGFAGAEEQTRSSLRAYDAFSRLISATDRFGRTVSYQYDPAGNLATLTDPTGRTTTYSYDAFNRVQAAQLPGLAQPVEYQWFPDGLMKQVTYPAGMSRVYEYDDADRVSRILNTVSAAESEEYVYGYDANGNRSTETRRQNGAVTRELSYGYDALNRLTSTEYRTPNLAPATTVWGYDAVGNRLAMTGQTWNGSPLDVAYAYNSVNQLIGLSDRVDPTKSLTMEYDGNGNLSRELSPSGVERRFVHDAFNQLRQVSLVTPRAQAGGTPLENPLGIYDYDFEGRRIHRWSAAEELYYVYNGLNVLTEYDRWNQVAATYDFGLPGGMMQQAQWQLLGNRLHSGVGGGAAGGASAGGLGALAGAGSVGVGGGAWMPDFGPPGDLARASFAGEGDRFYFHDALGSTTMLASLAPPPGGGSPIAGLAARYDYDPWGEQPILSNSSPNRVQFSGYRRDDETASHYAVARYYDGRSGRFLQPDPLFETSRSSPGIARAKTLESLQRWSFPPVSPFVYCQDNPLVLWDPAGRVWWVKQGREPIWEPAGFVNREWQAWFQSQGYVRFRPADEQEEYRYRVPDLGGEVIHYFGVDENGEPYRRTVFVGGATDLCAEAIEFYMTVSGTVGTVSLMTRIGKHFVRTGARRLAREVIEEAGDRLIRKEAVQSTDDLVKLGRGPTEVIARGPRRILNAAVAEEHGYQAALSDGHIGIRPPGKVTRPGRADFITYDGRTRNVVVWDAKYRGPGGHYPSAIPSETLRRWMPEVTSAIEAMPEGPAKVAAQEAFRRGNVTGGVFRWPE